MREPILAAIDRRRRVERKTVAAAVEAEPKPDHARIENDDGGRTAIMPMVVAAAAAVHTKYENK